MTLDSILQAYINGDPSEFESMVVPSHLAQMRLFMLRKGVKFYPRQDTPAETRKQWLERQLHRNRLSLYLPQIVNEMLCTGQLLFYLRPDGEGYRIIWFNKNNHKVFYNADGEINKAICTYNYEPEPEMMAGASGYERHMSVRLIITKKTIRYAERPGKNSFSLELMTPDAQNQTAQLLANEKVVRNSLGVLPCVVVKNHDPGPGIPGRDEFRVLEQQILTHAKMVNQINQNLQFFGSPTLITNRPVNDLLMTDDGSQRKPVTTMASQSGFVGSGLRPGSSMANYRDYQQHFQQRGGLKVKRIIGNMEPGDRAGYISPDPVSGDHNLHQKEYRESLRTMLGGVDELGIHSGATAFEIKSLFGRAAATAFEKCESLFTHGICELLSLGIKAEENFYRQGLAQRLVLDHKLAKQVGFNKPIIDNLHLLAHEPEQADSAGLDVYEELEKVFPEQLIHTWVQDGILVGEPEGLIPFGDRTIDWGWKGPVFEYSPREKLNLSIISRNMREDGIQTIETLKEQYPDKTERELQNMLGAYPFRVVSQLLQGLGALLQTQDSVLTSPIMNLPDPTNPEASLGQRYIVQISQIIDKNLESLTNELSHGAQYSNADPNISRTSADYGIAASPGTFKPGSNSELRSANPDPRSLPIPPGIQSGGSSIPTSPYPTGGWLGNPGGPFIQSASPTGAVPEPTGDVRDFVIPAPGSSVATAGAPTTNPAGPGPNGPNGIIPPAGPGYLQQPIIPGVPADILAQPWLFNQLYGAPESTNKPGRKPKR